MKYILIHNSEGETRIEEIDVIDFLEKLAEDWYGKNPIFLTELPKNKDTNYWGENTYLLVRGEIVSPKPKEVVKKYYIDGIIP